MPRIEPMSPYLRKSLASRMPRMSDGKTKPAVAAMAPPMPATFMPAKVAALMPMGPGVICEIVKMSMNCASVSQPYSSTTAAWMSGMEA